MPELETLIAGPEVAKVGLGFAAAPPAPLFVSRVAEGSWGAKCGFPGGEQILAVNGRLVSEMSQNDFTKAMQGRPIELFVDWTEAEPGVVEIETLIVDESVQKIGLGFDAAPPMPVFVDRVAASSWAQEKGFLGGEQILAINGLLVSKMDINDFKKQMKGRPIELLIDWTAEDPSKLVATLEADASVVNLGLGFEGAPPGPMRVRKVDSKSWAEEMRLKGGELLLEVNGIPVAELSREKLAAALRKRPLALRVDRSAQKKAEQAPEEEIFARRLIVLPLQKISLICDVIASHFETGESLEDTAEALRSGQLQMGDEVTRFHGFVFSLDGRRLASLGRAFPGTAEVEVWEECFRRAEIAKEFYEKLASSAPGAEASGTVISKAESKPVDAAANFARSLCDDRDQEALLEIVRAVYLKHIAEIQKQCDAAVASLNAWHSELDRSSSEVTSAVLQTLSKASGLTAVDFYQFLTRPPRLKLLKEALMQLVAARKVIAMGDPAAEGCRFLRAEMPSGHPLMHVEKAESVWVFKTSSMARHLDAEFEVYAGSTLWRAAPLPPPAPNAKAGAKAPRKPTPPAQVVVELHGAWEQSDELLLGMWPQDTDLDQLWSFPGPEHGKGGAPAAPGVWISCTTGSWLSKGRKLSPLAWTAPSKKAGVRWALRFENSSLSIACADTGRDFQWQGRQWFAAPPVVDFSDPAPALLWAVRPSRQASNLEVRLLEPAKM